MGPEFVLGIAAFLIAYHFGMRYVLVYRFTDRRVEVLLFGILPVSSTSYDRITQVSINSYMRVFIGWAVWIPNRVVGPFVLIRRSGLAVLMTPAKPEEFARELSLRVQERTGEWPLAS